MLSKEQTTSVVDAVERKLKWALALGVTLVALVTYLLTMAPTLSFWDCGEFVASASTLGIPHPPGTPFFVVLGRVAIILFGFMDDFAIRLNLISAISSALAVGVCFLIAWETMALAFANKGPEKALRRFALVTGSLTGAFLVAFSDTFWFSAVEAEVYGTAMFMLFVQLLLVLWWIPARATAWGDKLLLLIVYVAFLGIGVHLYTMLLLPATFALVLWLKPELRTSAAWPFWVIPALLYSAAVKVDMFPFLILASLATAIVGLLVVKPESKYPWRLSFWVTLLALIGYSTHAYLPVRSSQNPIIDESDPEVHSFSDVVNVPFMPKGEDSKFEAFLSRKQYIQSSMLSRSFHRRGNPMHQFFSYAHMGYGGYQLAQYLPWKVGFVQSGANGVWGVSSVENPPVVRGGHAFETQMAHFFGEGSENVTWRNYIRPVALVLLFNLLLYFSVAALYRRNKALGIFMGAAYVLPSLGLIWYMNFADGTRPDAEIFLQKDALPKDMEDFRKANGRSMNDAELQEHILSRYGNVQKEVRERDYFYTPAYMIMGVMLGFGLGLGLVELARRRERQSWVKPLGIGATALACVVPAWSNWADHDRTGNYTPYDLGFNYLSSTEKDAILFTYGDNDTFPLWALQETYGIRKDVRVVNTSLGSTSWYIRQMLTQAPKVNLVFLADSAALARVDRGSHPTLPMVQLAFRTLDTLEQYKNFLASPEVQANAEVKAQMEAKVKSREFNAKVWQGFLGTRLGEQVGNAMLQEPQIQSEVLALRERIKTDTAQGLKDSLYLQEQILGLAQFGRSLGNPEYTENTLMALYQSLADSIQTPSANNNPYGELVRQVQTFKAKAIAGMLNGMSTKDLLILDVVLHNPDRPVFFSGMDGEWGMPMDRHYWYGWTIGLDRQGDRASNPEVARHLTDSLVNTVFKFRSLGDPNVNLNEESQEQMLRSHEITLVFNLAEPYLRARQMARLGPVGPFRYENLMSTPYPALDPASLGALKPMVNASMPSLNKYLSLFPTRALGYKFKADAQVLAGDMAGAKKTMEECKSKVDVHWLADCESAAKNLTIASAPAATPGFSGFPGMMSK